MRPKLSAIACLALVACASPPSPISSVMVAPGITLALPGPDELGRSVEAVQMVTARHGTDTMVFEARLSVRPGELRLVCLDSMGRRAMTVTWADGHLTAERATWVPDGLRPENILADIILLYWPEPVLRRSLRGAALTQDGTARAVGDAIRVEWQGDPWDGVARLRNIAWNYQLDVQSAQVDR